MWIYDIKRAIKNLPKNAIKLKVLDKSPFIETSKISFWMGQKDSLLRPMDYESEPQSHYIHLTAFFQLFLSFSFHIKSYLLISNHLKNKIKTRFQLHQPAFRLCATITSSILPHNKLRTNFALKRYSHISSLCRWYLPHIPGPAFSFPVDGQTSRKWIAA